MNNFDTAAACLQYLTPMELGKMKRVSKSINESCERACSMTLLEFTSSTKVRLVDELYLDLWACIWIIQRNLSTTWPSFGKNALDLGIWCVLGNKPKHLPKETATIAHFCTLLPTIAPTNEIAENICNSIQDFWKSKQSNIAPMRKTIIGTRLGHIGWWNQATRLLSETSFEEVKYP